MNEYMPYILIIIGNLVIWGLLCRVDRLEQDIEELKSK